MWPNIFFRLTEEFVKLSSTCVTVFWSQVNQNLTLSLMDLALDYNVSSLDLSFLQNTHSHKSTVPVLARGSRWFTEMLASLGMPEMLDSSTVY